MAKNGDSHIILNKRAIVGGLNRSPVATLFCIDELF